MKRKIYTLALNGAQCGDAIALWHATNQKCDLIVRRGKTGVACLQAQVGEFDYEAIKWLGSVVNRTHCKVDIKDL